jgi:GR25 family glycosyltransferase involved in LPS biosynthesis
MKYKVFVISAYEERKDKYLNDNRYTLFEAIHWTDIKDDVLKNYHFRWNAKDELKRKIVACSESHLKCLKHIYDNKIDNCIIIEDDAVLDFARLNELDDIKQFCYIGGMFFPPLIKDKKDFEKPHFEIGLNIIDPERFVIHNCHGMYIPNYKLVPPLMRQTHIKRRAIDHELKQQQLRKDIEYFIYPAISTLHLKDACCGFTWSSYKLPDNLYFY